MTVSKRTIKQCQKNSRRAQKKIYEEFSQVIFAISMRYLKDRAKAEDNMHETFVTVFEKITQYSGKGSFDGWIKRIAVNNALMYIRKNKKVFTSDDFSYFEDDNKTEKKVYGDVDPQNIREIIERANFSRTEVMELVSELPDGFRTVFNLYVVEEFKHKDIAEKMEISEGTSKSQYARARVKLQQILYDAALIKIKNK
ncbi:MAG: RNA polymerase sigma factor [Bacteroidota bacterium]|nr:RNA polymerase sigma factor [Bacteroidota bacterium]